MIDLLIAGVALMAALSHKRSKREAANVHMDGLLREHKRILLKEMK